ncbi:MAG: hypothetical protein K1W17_11910 [Oscillospiraceae bacterium]
MTNLAQKANKLALKAYVKADIAKDRAKRELSELSGNEFGVSGIVVSLILIAIAIALAVVFREKISEFMDKVFGNADKTLEEI